MSADVRGEEQERTEEVPVSVCRSVSDNGKDEWYCTLDAGHEGDHQAYGPRTGRLFHAWPNETPPPRVWSLPAEPGPEVTRVRDCDGDAWNRVHAGGWSLNGGYPSSWVGVLQFGPLTDATPTGKADEA